MSRTIDIPFLKARRLFEIACNYPDSGLKDKAFQILSEALGAAGVIDDAFGHGAPKAYLLADIAIKYAQGGRYGDALAVTKTIGNEGAVCWPALAYLTGKCAVVEPRAEASEILGQVLQVVAEHVNNTTRKGCRLADIARRYAEVGFREKGLEVARRIERPAIRVNVLVGLAAPYMAAGQSDKACEILGEALEAAHAVEHAYTGAGKLADVAGGYAEVGEYDKARRVVQMIEIARFKASAPLHVSRGGTASFQQMIFAKDFRTDTMPP